MNDVLIAEDSEFSGPALAVLLDASGFRAVLAESLHGAREVLAASPPLALVADVNLPDGDGIALIPEAKALRPDCVCVVVTGMDSPEIADRARAAGAVAVFIKPLRFAELLKLLPSPAGPETVR